jgi:protein-S-isoprenylcysteine O-methyltransferase Ste14
MVGTILLLFRMYMEEEMLVEAFISDYKNYQRKTKKLVPNIY